MTPYSSTESPWSTRIHHSQHVHKAWETLFQCDKLTDYYEGFQWKEKKDNLNVNYRPYTVNMVYSTIKIKLANLLFQRPTFIISPTPGNSHWDLDTAVQSAQIKQDVLNAIVHNPNMKFTKHIKRSALDSFFRFGLMEVGYSADWQNPQKTTALMTSWSKTDVEEEKDRIIDDHSLPINERFYVKRINPRRFICSISEECDLGDHDWVGYYEYYYTNYLRKIKGIKWPENRGFNDTLMGREFIPLNGVDNRTEIDGLIRSGAVSKVWNIFDKVSSKRLLLLDGAMEELWSGPLERYPLIDIRWDFRTDGFYPIPPVFQWLSPQDEINEAREQMRSYRRRFTAKYQAIKGMVEPDELDKFAMGPDGVVIEVKEKDAIGPIQNPTLGAVNTQDLTISRDEFNIVSGTSADARGQDTDRTTATQSKIIDMRTQIRESAEQLDFTEFVGQIGRELLCQAQEKMVNGIWVKYTWNPAEGPLMDMQVNAPIFKLIQSQEISDGYDFTIDIDVQNSTPAAAQAAQTAFVNFVSFLEMHPMLAMSPQLIRECAYRFGYKNEMVIHQVQQVAALAMAAKVGQAANQQGQTLSGAMENANANNAAKTQLAQAQIPSGEEIQAQINNQIQ